MRADIKTIDVGTILSNVARRYLQLQLTTDVGPVRLRNLLTYFGSIEAVLTASMAQLERVEGVGPRIARSIFQSRTDELVEAEVSRAQACGVRIICMEDSDYPVPLRNIPDPPICLYVRGQLEPADSVALAIVGTRRCSHYGREQAVRFGRMLGGAGFTVVSGLARGIDGCAHQGALQGGGRTLAVLGNGLATVYPQEHDSLADKIVRTGALLSELPLDAPPVSDHFPRRNRIIIGLSLGVIVIEAGKRSGALITARLASEYNREVFALPGHVDQPAVTAGVHGLIRDGHAKLITGLDDVLDELGPVGEIMGSEAAGSSQPTESQPDDRPLARPKLAGDERAVVDAIASGAQDVDTIRSRTGLETGRVLALLTRLELKGVIRQESGNRFVVRS